MVGKELTILSMEPTISSKCEIYQISDLIAK